MSMQSMLRDAKRDAKLLHIISRYKLWVRFRSDLHLYNELSCYSASNQERSILIVGDGDLSFSASMALSNTKGTKLISTVLESEAEHRSIYKKSSQNIDTIRKSGHQVRFQVDARCLPKYFDSKTTLFDRIQWNFPHDKGRTNARKNRELVKQFFLSSKEVLNPSGGQVHLGLFDHHGGAYSTTLEHWKQSWMPARYAAEFAGLLLNHVLHFEPEYSISSYQWKDKPFLTRGKKQMYIFSVADSNSNQIAVPQDLQLFSSFTVYSDPTKLALLDFIQSCVPHGIRVETSLQSIKSCKEKTTFLASSTYTAKNTVFLYGEKTPMTQQLAEDFRLNLGNILSDKGRVSSWNASHVKPSFLRHFEFF